MANRKRTNPVQFYLDDDEQYILDEKFRVSGMKSKSAFLRKLILYGYVYDVDYSYLRNYNTELGRISSNLNQIAKRINSTGNIYQEDMDEKFRVSGMKSKSAFLRKLILYGYVYDVDYSYLRNYNTELGRISSNLNQIAKRINSTGNIYQEDMDEVKELMNEVWRTQKSMLSKQPLIKR